MGLTVRLADEAATESLGAAIAEVIEGGDVVLLVGELGAGKTTLVRGLVRQLGGHAVVTSPTFTLRHEYETEPALCHVDCWRLRDPAELDDLGLDDVLSDGGVLVVEWGDLAAQRFGVDALRVELEDADGGSSRIATLSATTARFGRRLGRLVLALGARGLDTTADDGSGAAR